MPDLPLILTGFMGSGKSSVGKLLAHRLGLAFVDLDEVIVTAAGKSINRIFTEDGETAFRELESIALAGVLKNGKGIIATGGGVVLSESNRKLMSSHGIVINLMVSLSQVLERLAYSVDRPLFKGQSAPEHVSNLMKERERFYAESDIKIDTNEKSVEDVVVEILCLLKRLTA